MTYKFRHETSQLCDCGSGLHVLSHSRICESCERYNAAVKAQTAAAECFAETRIQHYAGPKHAWLNAFGAFGFDDKGVMVRTATAEEVAPFAELTTMVRRISKPTEWT